MPLTMAEKKSVTREMARRYAKGPKKQKAVILDELTVLTGWTTCHASWRLRLRNYGACWRLIVYK